MRIALDELWALTSSLTKRHFRFATGFVMAEAWRCHSPPVLTTAEITLASARMTTRSPFTLLWRARFIYHQCAAHQLPTVTRSHCLLGGGVIIDLYESESPGLAAETVAKDADAVDLHTHFLEKCLNIRLHSLVGQVS
jgi:hypothetical protein